MNSLLYRIMSKYQRTVADLFYRRTLNIKMDTPVISFSFDDAPRKAFCEGGDILKSYGALGTYFISLGLLGSESPGGFIATEDDLRHALLDGHELGCHTYDHQDSWKASTAEFEQSLLKNQRALSVLFPDATFRSFAYPISSPRPAIKRLTGKNFHCCRGGGQTINVDTADLNLLKAYFLDIRNRNNIDAVKMVIDHNVGCRGWLIFATHDVAEVPSRYGCTKDYFNAVVKYASGSGATLLTVAKAFEHIQSASTKDITAN